MRVVFMWRVAPNYLCLYLCIYLERRVLEELERAADGLGDPLVSVAEGAAAKRGKVDTHAAPLLEGEAQGHAQRRL